ncbi:MAG: diguanylate cyclase, partial [Cyanobacteria bacterium P01_A01_bin.135]
MLQNLSLRSYLLLLVIAAIGLSGLAYSQPQSAAIHMAQELAIAALMLVSGVMVGLRKTGQPEQADATFSVEQLRRFAEATAATTGPNVFSVLAQHAAQTLEAPYVLLLEKREDELLHLLAIASDSELNVDTIYATAGMPCEVVLRQGQFYCDRDLQQRFPADTLLKATNAKGYLGIAICGGDGEALGVLCLIDQQPLRNLQQAEDVLRIFASRAALEIERQRATAALQQLNADLEARVESRTAELWEREQFLQTVLDTFPVSVFWKDRQSVYLGANRNFLDNAGLRSAAELIGKTDYDLPWHREETEAYRADDAAVVASGTAKLNIAETQLQPDGSVLWLETNKLPLRSSAGAIIGVLGTYQDITARKQAELALQQSENRLRLIADSVCACISYVDAEQRYQFVNATYEAWFDQPKESILGCRVEALIGPVAYQQARSYVERALTGETVSYEMDMPYPRGGLRYISAVLVPDIAPAGKVQGYYALIHDITDLKQTQQRLAYSALHDPLTNLPNRRLLTKRIGLAIQQARQCPEQTYAVLLLDVDRFKVVNDSLGHAVGDQLLQAIAARLIRWVTDQDCVARLGGDEFMILLEDSGGPEAVTPLIEYILAESEQPVMIGGYEIFTGFSVGVVFGNAAYTSASDLIRDADIAMYRVKAAGGNGYQVFDRAMHAQVVERLNLETALRKALDQQEFAVHYQPIINLYDQQLVGFEALARWPHPTGQVVM